MQILIAFGMLFTFLSTPVSQPGTCTLPPLTLPLFGGTPAAEVVVPIASPAAEAPTDAEIEAALEMFATCINTGEPTLVWAIFTPSWFAEQFDDSTEHYQPAFEIQLEAPVFATDAPIVLDSMEEIEYLADGRVAVTVTYASEDMLWTDRLILAKVDGVWLIDEVELLGPGN